MKVVHLVSGLRGGGAEQMILGLCRLSLADATIEAKVVSMSYINDIADRFQGIPVYPCDIASDKRRDNRAAGSLRAIRHLLRSEVDIIHAHMFYACMAGVIVKILRRRTRVVFTLHNSFQPRFFFRLLLFLTRPLRDVDIIFPNTPPAWYQKPAAKRIPNGIDPEKFEVPAKRATSPFIILFAGRLDRQKQPWVLVDIARRISPARELVIRVTGEGPLLKPLRQKIRSEKLESCFEFLGFRNDISELLASAHCVVLPSSYEGMPLIVLEAAAAGVPIVATPEAVASFAIDNDEAWISPAASIPSAIEELMTSYDVALRKSLLAKERLSVYTLQSCFKAHTRLYKAVMRSAHDTRGQFTF